MKPTPKRKNDTVTTSTTPRQAMNHALTGNFHVRSPAFLSFMELMESEVRPKLHEVDWQFFLFEGGKLALQSHGGFKIVEAAKKVAVDDTLKKRVQDNLKSLFPSGVKERMWNKDHSGEDMHVQLLLAVAYYLKAKRRASEIVPKFSVPSLPLQNPTSPGAPVTTKTSTSLSTPPLLSPLASLPIQPQTYTLYPIEYVLSPDVTPSIAFQLMWNIFDTTPGRCFFVKPVIVEQMRVVAGALHYPPALFWEFLSIMKTFSKRYPGHTPDFLDIIFQCWRKVLSTVDDKTKLVGRTKMDQFQKQLVQLYQKIKFTSGTTIELPINKLHISVPFPIFALLYNCDWTLDTETMSWKHLLLLLKPVKGFGFEGGFESTLKKQGALLLSALFTGMKYYPDPNSAERLSTLSFLFEVNTSWMALYKSVTIKTDVRGPKSTEKADCVVLGLKREEYKNDTVAPDEISNIIQLTARTTGLEPKCLKFWLAGLGRPENAIYTFASAVELLPTAVLLEYLSGPRIVTIGTAQYYKEFCINGR
ncbi:hypothetical protein Pelo_17326 [Pelomyxa schiedti]|nr:hypothetical protein Pelo_17326 [Pelomyxa schiedti]